MEEWRKGDKCDERDKGKEKWVRTEYTKELICLLISKGFFYTNIDQITVDTFTPNLSSFI
jgi:hypothetical protein